MGLLDRLRGMISEMDEDEKKEFFEEFEKQKQPSSEQLPQEPVEVPDAIPCSEEQTRKLVDLRESIIAAKIALGKLLVDIEEKKSIGIAELKNKEDTLVEVIQSIKLDLIADSSLFDSYMIELSSDSEGNEIATLKRQ